jgi:hypothetical protein
MRAPRRRNAWTKPFLRLVETASADFWDLPKKMVNDTPLFTFARNGSVR